MHAGGRAFFPKKRQLREESIKLQYDDLKVMIRSFVSVWRTHGCRCGAGQGRGEGRANEAEAVTREKTTQTEQEATRADAAQSLTGRPVLVLLPSQYTHTCQPD